MAMTTNINVTWLAFRATEKLSKFTIENNQRIIFSWLNRV